MLKEHGPKKLLLCLYAQRFILVELKFGEFHPPEVQHGATSTHIDASTVQLEEGYDFFSAVDETAVRLFSQILKPINTAVSHFDGLQNYMTGSSQERVDPEVLRKAVKHVVKFSEIRDIQDSQSSTGDVHLKLELQGGRTLLLPMGRLPSTSVAESLVKGLRLAAQQGVANWDDLRVALQDEKVEQRMLHSSGGAGQRVLEVFEVESFNVVSKEWKTPNWGSMIETETSWRWLDSSGCRHPHLIPGDKTLAVNRRIPPVELDKSLYQPYSPWHIDRSQGDEDGWQYGMAWNTSTWVAIPGPFDMFRRRRWTRTYI